jgi:2-polyprenyl-3-methyl-5-hydroxy-6-metoxy-1,4-benzoquinol methylase
MHQHPFNRNGIASLRDLNAAEFQQLFAELEEHQRQFREIVQFPENYRWAKDPLHTWSRVWEYPYVYHQLKVLRNEFGSTRTPEVMDFGSGVTFFPFAIASLGYNVTCVDVDKSYQSAIEAAAVRFNLNGGSISAKCIAPEASAYGRSVYDCVYSISVVEHIPECSKTIRLLSDSLKNNGFFIATLDLDLEQDGLDGVPNEQLLMIQNLLSEGFTAVYQNPTISPAVMLTSQNSPYRSGQEVGLAKFSRFAKDRVVKPLIGRPIAHRYRLTCEGWVHRKRPTA